MHCKLIQTNIQNTGVQDKYLKHGTKDGEIKTYRLVSNKLELGRWAKVRRCRLRILAQPQLRLNKQFKRLWCRKLRRAAGLTTLVQIVMAEAMNQTLRKSWPRKISSSPRIE